MINTIVFGFMDGVIGCALLILIMLIAYAIIEYKGKND